MLGAAGLIMVLQDIIVGAMTLLGSGVALAEKFGISATTVAKRFIFFSNCRTCKRVDVCRCARS